MESEPFKKLNHLEKESLKEKGKYKISKNFSITLLRVVKKDYEESKFVFWENKLMKALMTN